MPKRKTLTTKDLVNMIVNDFELKDNLGIPRDARLIIDDGKILVYENGLGKWTYNHEINGVTFEPSPLSSYTLSSL